MRRTLIVLCFLLNVSMFSQETTAEIITSRPLKADIFIGVDKFENTYFIKDNTIYIEGPKGNHEYTALNLGEISSVDIINPLKITVFYRNANTAVILDNTLSEIKRINFSTIDTFRNVSHASTANDRRLWIFNTDLQQLEIFDYRQDKIVTEFPPRPGIPDATTSNFNFCWTIVEGRLEKYNNYGAFINATSLGFEAEDLKQFHGKTVLKSGEKLYNRRTPLDPFTPIENIEIPVKQFSLNDEILYIYDGQNLTTIRLKPSQKK